ncbi:u2 snrnp component ist3 [Niveomyces insectorum RCEF 264]|uniref:U2 snrnp component ist3 n=1 Tax=Niveomyces insectorum RCEF 264 TaxID=1081102 RepID=A0A167T5C3_9HYPO|nr:u2 snrnp component ist3 [Niveomyces insectorum RCEF 264]
MNKIRQIQELNKKELEQGISPQASWHTDYRDTAFVYFGGLPFELSEGDIITIFSQFGEPVFLKLARDRETGKSKGFGWLKYEDQRSTDLAVDNLGGASIDGRLVHVDHARYKARDDEDLDKYKVGWADLQRQAGAALPEEEQEEDSDTDMEDRKAIGQESGHRKRSPPRLEPRPLLPEERELQRLIDEHDDEDPMKEFLVEEKKKEVAAALLRRADAERNETKSRHSHRHHHHDHHRHRSHRSRREEGDDTAMEDADGKLADRAQRTTTQRHGSEDEDGRRERHRRRRHSTERRTNEVDNDRDSERKGDKDRARHRDRKPEDEDRDGKRDNHDPSRGNERRREHYRDSDRDRDHRRERDRTEDRRPRAR